MMSQPSMSFGAATNHGPHEAAGGGSSEKLLQVSLNIDESHLMKHIQQVVQRAMQYTRQEVAELKHHAQKTSDDVHMMRKELQVLQETKIQGLASTLLDVKNALCDSCAGAKAFRKAKQARIERQEAAEAGGYYEPEAIYDAFTRDDDAANVDGTDVELESERIQALEVQCAQLLERMRVVSEVETPELFHGLSKRMDAHVAHSEQVLRHLGLSTHEQHPGTLLFTLHSVTESVYMKPFVESIEKNERRVRGIEDNMRLMCQQKDLDELKFSVSDVRGAVDAAKESIAANTKQLSERIQASWMEMKGDLAGKVSWVDLDHWKGSVTESMTKSKNVATQQQHAMAELRAANLKVDTAIEDLKERVATLVMSVNSTSTTTKIDANRTRINADAAATPPLTSSHENNQRNEETNHNAAAATARSTSTGLTEQVDDLSSLLEGVDSITRRKITNATQAAYYAYADAGPPVAAGGVVVVNRAANFSSAARPRPRSALLLRK